MAIVTEAAVSNCPAVVYQLTSNVLSSQHKAVYKIKSTQICIIQARSEQWVTILQPTDEPPDIVSGFCESFRYFKVYLCGTDASGKPHAVSQCKPVAYYTHTFIAV